jgi:LuxR family maltose regulon positive regulatory protein
LRALTRQAQGRTDSALSELEQALTLAEPESYLRPFCDEGEAMRELLTRLRPRLHEARGRAYADRVLAALAAIDLPVVVPTSDVEPLSEPLNDREQEVLRLIADGLSNREIADRLVIAVGTVKWYINNLYGKLGVTSRTQALARAKELRLL